MKPIDSIYQLQANDIEKASKILGAAFIDYPSFHYLFPDILIRKTKIGFVMQFFLKCAISKGHVISTSNKMEGILVYYNSECLTLSLWRMIRSGLLSLIFRLGLKSFLEFKRLGDTKRFHRKMFTKGQYIFIDLLGVNPFSERKGFASILLREVLFMAEKERKNVILETSNVNNIEFYKKFGFSFLTKYNHNELNSFYLVKEC